VREHHPFVQHLYDLAAGNDRAALAELRRSFANPLAALPYVVPFLRKDASAREEDALSLVASLFSLHPVPGHVSLAKALALCAKESDSIELRFRALLDSDPEDLSTHLRHAVSLARSKDIPIDYDDLLGAIRWWGREDKDRQRAWARDFWGTTEATTEETAT
jgi:CRISPR system Cascade subunit CasB